MEPPIRLRKLPLTPIAMLTLLMTTATSAFASLPTTVPEPLSITLLGVGLAGLAGKKWMDNRRKS